MIKILVTGASGFVGKHILNELKDTDHHILALTRQDINFDGVEVLCGDLNNIEKLKSKIIDFQPDTVIHLAWQGIPDYSESISRVNLINSIDLLDFILSSTRCKKLLVSGSCWEYGKREGTCKESDPVDIDSYFSWAKNSLNQYLSIKCAKKNVTLNWFRIFYIYGPGQREEALIPMLIKTIGAKETPQINTPLDKIDFIYVEDVASAFVKALDTDISSGVYNLGSGNATSVYDICRIVEKQLLGAEPITTKVTIKDEKRETVNFWASLDLIKNELNWSPQIPLDQGILNINN